MGSIPIRENEIVNIFGVEFRYSTRFAFRIRRKMRKRNVFSPTKRCGGNSVNLKQNRTEIRTHRSIASLPSGLIHISILTAAQLMFHDDVGPVYLPLVRRREWKHRGLVAFGRGVQQLGYQTIPQYGVMMDELGQCTELGLRRYVHLVVIKEKYY